MWHVHICTENHGDRFKPVVLNSIVSYSQGLFVRIKVSYFDMYIMDNIEMVP